jgi:hypothetical protein
MRELIDLIENDEGRTEDEDNLRVRALEKKIQQFCEKTLNWSFNSHSYSVIYSAEDGEITLSPDNEEITLDELSKLSVLGDAIRISSSTKPYALTIIIKAHPGLHISTN